MKVEIYGDGLGYVSNEVSTIETSLANACVGNREKFVTDLAAISRNKDESNDPGRRYVKLLKEAAPALVISENGLRSDLLDGFDHMNESFVKTPSRPFEFLPVIVDYTMTYNDIRIVMGDQEYLWSFEDFNNDLGQFSYLERDVNALVPQGKMYTNMRALINAGVDHSHVPFATSENIELYKHFKAYKLNVPMFVFNHLITHTALSKEARSERMIELKDHEYWLPEDLMDRNNRYITDGPDNDIKNMCMCADEVFVTSGRDVLVKFYLDNYSQNQLQGYLKALGYAKEIYQRAMLEFRYKPVIITGWSNNPKSFAHLLNERNSNKHLKNCKNWTQTETTIAVNAIKEILISE